MPAYRVYYYGHGFSPSPPPAYPRPIVLFPISPLLYALYFLRVYFTQSFFIVFFFFLLLRSGRQGAVLLYIVIKPSAQAIDAAADPAD